MESINMKSNFNSVPTFMCYILVTLGILFLECSEKPLDFKTMNKIDAHIHVNTDSTAFLEAAVENNFRLLTINTYVSYYPEITKQRDLANFQQEKFPGRIAYAATFSLEGFEEPDWQEKTIAYLDESFEKGAIAVKVWKNIGMELKNKQGNFVMVDDTDFDPIFSYLAEKGIPVVGHIGEPKNCWLPLEEMTVKSDKEYFESHPKYHMYLHSEYPAYEDIVNSRDRMLEKHPDLKFIGCHLGSLEWSVDELGKRLKQFPNFAVDFAARIGHFQYQSKEDRERVRNFFIEFQDQLLYGTDLQTDGTDKPDELKARMSEKWQSDWTYFTTEKTISIPNIDGEFIGLNLPQKVIKKIYWQNARKWYPGL